MKRSPLRTPLAVLRVEILKMGMKDFARICGIPAKTLGSYEIDTRTLKEEPALQISQATGVSCAWLLARDTKAMPIAQYLPKKRSRKGIQLTEFTKKVYEDHRRQIENLKKEPKRKFRLYEMVDECYVLGRILAASTMAIKKFKGVEAHFMMIKLADDMTRKFGTNRHMQAEFEQKITCVNNIQYLFTSEGNKDVKKAFKTLLKKSHEPKSHPIFHAISPLLQDIQQLVRSPRFLPIKKEKNKYIAAPSQTKKDDEKARLAHVKKYLKKLKMSENGQNSNNQSEIKRSRKPPAIISLTQGLKIEEFIKSFPQLYDEFKDE